jgi:hypothetical protein
LGGKPARSPKGEHGRGGAATGESADSKVRPSKEPEMASNPKRSDERDDTDDGERDTDSGDPTSLDIDVSITSKSPRVTRDTDRELTPPDSRSVTARSRTEMVGKPKSAPGKKDDEDTLLSVDEDPRDTANDNVVSERSNQAVEELERRVVQLEARIQVIEIQRGGRPSEDRKWLFWVGLLLALGLGWQLRSFFQ